MVHEEFVEMMLEMGWSGPKPTINPNAHPDEPDAEDEDD